MGSDNCDHSCSNTDGSFICLCDSGFTLASDGHTCNGILIEIQHAIGSTYTFLLLPVYYRCG